MTRVTIKLPQLIFVDDYHEFRYLEEYLNLILNKPKIKIVEISFDQDQGQYVGIVYSGKKPTRKILQKLCSHHNLLIETSW